MGNDELEARLVKHIDEAPAMEQSSGSSVVTIIPLSMEIASYQLLERIACKAGDEETAEAAAQNRADEEKMAKTIEQNWDKFAELSLKEEGIKV